MANNVPPDTRSAARKVSDRQKLQSIRLAGPGLRENFRRTYEATVQAIDAAALPRAFRSTNLPTEAWQELALYTGHVVQRDAAELLLLERTVKDVLGVWGVNYGVDGLVREVRAMRPWDESRVRGHPDVEYLGYIGRFVERDARIRWALEDRREKVRVAQAMLESVGVGDEPEPEVNDGDAGVRAGAVEREEEVKQEGDVKEEDGSEGVEIKTEPADDM